MHFSSKARDCANTKAYSFHNKKGLWNNEVGKNTFTCCHFLLFICACNKYIIITDDEHVCIIVFHCWSLHSVCAMFRPM